MKITWIISIILVSGGFFFFATATIGLLRFPDFFSRLHATGKGDTLAVILSLCGLSIYEGFSLTGLKLLLIALFIMLAQPIATHSISRSALRCGVKPWTREKKNK